MSDRLGALELPAGPIISSAERIKAPGDPGLVVLGSFLSTVIQAECGAAWSTLFNFQPIENAIEPGRDGNTAVRLVHYANLEDRLHQIADAPFLVLYRAGRAGASFEQIASDMWRATRTVIVQWVPAQASIVEHGDFIRPFGNAISAAVKNAVRNMRHPAWVHTSDAPMPDALLLTRATSTVPQVLSPLDGPGAGRTLDYPRQVVVSTQKSSATYTTAEPILVTGYEKGAERRIEVWLSNQNGGETVASVWRIDQPTKVEIPAMLRSIGSLRVGFAASPHARRGSPVAEKAGISEITFLADGEWRSLRLPLGAPVPDGGIRVFEMSLRVVEDLDQDPRVHADAFGAAENENDAGLELNTFQGSDTPWSTSFL